MGASVLLLLSGGMDSMVALHKLQMQERDIHALFIDYGQEWMTYERDAAISLANHFNIPLEFQFAPRLYIRASDHFTPMRNAFLLSLAVNEACLKRIQTIAIGSSKCEFLDQTAEFIDRFNFMTDMCFKTRAPYVVAPVCGWSRNRVVTYALLHALPISLTRSCMVANPLPCGECFACKVRKKYGVV